MQLGLRKFPGLVMKERPPLAIPRLDSFFGPAAMTSCAVPSRAFLQVLVIGAVAAINEG